MKTFKVSLYGEFKRTIHAKDEDTALTIAVMYYGLEVDLEEI